MAASERKTELLDCAEGIIQRVGINAMSYQDLSDAIGIRKASIHHHFAKKEDLILALQERCRVNYAQRYLVIAESAAPAATKLMQLAEIFANSAAEQKLCFVTMLSAEYASLSPQSQAHLQTTVEGTTAIVETIIRQGIEVGDFSSVSDSQATAFAYISLLMGGHMLARSKGGCDSLIEAARAFVDNLHLSV
ncbi:MAG: TetR/AcrR family transcriptional regulator [Verrucomicrobiota bacterium]